MFCSVAQKAYVNSEVPFLMDQSDTVLAYEQRGVDELLGQHPLMALTDSMDRVQQLEAIYGESEVHRWRRGHLTSVDVCVIKLRPTQCVFFPQVLRR